MINDNHKDQHSYFPGMHGKQARGHWTKSHKRAKTQIKAVSAFISPLAISTPCSIHLVRYAPRLIDNHDNLPYSFKNIVDFIAAKLIPGFNPGKSDSHPDLTWSYGQVKSKEKIIEITFDF